MRLYPDLIRLILLEGEQEDTVDLTSYSEDQINYHRAQLINAGYAEGHIYSGGFGPISIPEAEIFDLTWEGHQFLANARNNTVWNRAKAEVAKQGGSIAIDTLKALLVKVASDMFGIT